MLTSDASAFGSLAPPRSSSTPLIVDVDGCLLRTDLLWEGLLNVVLRHPARLPFVLAAALHGRASLKVAVARLACPALDVVPLEPSVVRLIEDARRESRTVLLLSGADAAQVAVVCARVGASGSFGSDTTRNLTGATKLRLLHELAAQYDYVGNARADLPLWAAARRPYAVNAGPVTRWLARRSRLDLVLLPSPVAPWQAWLRAIRPHQWSKNLLLVVPALAAHLHWTPRLALLMLAGLLAWSLAASAVYVINDLIDLPHDRVHARKYARPFAAGDLSIAAGLRGTLVLAMLALALALPLGGAFTGAMLGYVALALTYSLALKRLPMVDVIALATLYATRVVAGSLLVGVELSRWFLAFSIFGFFSLALIKRVVEIQGSQQRRMPAGESPADESPAGDSPAGQSPAAATLAGRGYRVEDAPVLIALGAAATIVSSLVYCLYISSPDVLRIYHRPDVLWAGLPALLYLMSRAWLLVARGAMNEDPVVYALTDHASRVAVLLFLAVVVIASR